MIESTMIKKIYAYLSTLYNENNKNISEFAIYFPTSASKYPLKTTPI
jgi:hypothetical protein